MDRHPLALVAGAGGFVGRHLCPALAAAGYRIRCGSRSPARARDAFAQGQWVQLDVSDPRSVETALDGCDVAVYLVHQLDQGPSYPDEEARSARYFSAAATRAGVRRVTYLGGVEPRGSVSKHLRSRLQTGRILAQGFAQTVELRASMIIGRGGASFELVCRLAARLPVVAEPSFLSYRSCPVAIDDVVAALVATLLLKKLPPGCYDVPGPEYLSHRNVLRRVAAWQGHAPRLLRLPQLPVAWSAYAVALATGTDLHLCRQLLEGLQSDLVPARERSIWRHLPGYQVRSVDAAIHDASTDPPSTPTPSPRTRRRLVAAAAELVRQLGP
jgi:uncharacterized protein YbjT (DUF2867 family)